MTATHTFDVFSSLVGFGSASGYCGKQGPELPRIAARFDHATAEIAALVLEYPWPANIER
jgi:hypothetical protein